MSRVGSLPLSLTRTRLNSRSVSPLPLSSALSAETARLDFGTFGTRFCYIGTWNIRKTLPFLKVSIVLNSAGRLSLSLSLSLSPSASLKLEKKRLQNRASFLVLASLFRGTRARRTRWVLLFSRVFALVAIFYVAPTRKKGNCKTKCKSARVCFYGGTTVLLLVLFTIRLIYACIPTLTRWRHPRRSRSARNTPRLCGVRYTRE